MPIKLICEFAHPNEQVFTQPVIKVGKLSSSHFLVEHPDVSRMHAVIEEDGEGYAIIDLGSHKGTKVDGMKINKAKLIEGSLIEMGKVVIRVYTEDVKVTPPKPKEPDIIDDYFGIRKTLRKIVAAKEKMTKEKVVGEAGGGLVKIEFTGDFCPLDVFVDPLVVEDKDAGMVRDLVMAALTDAHDKFEKMAEEVAKNA